MACHCKLEVVLLRHNNTDRQDSRSRHRTRELGWVIVVLTPAATSTTACSYSWNRSSWCIVPPHRYKVPVVGMPELLTRQREALVDHPPTAESRFEA